jgi:hypothetical protein
MLSISFTASAPFSASLCPPATLPPFSLRSWDFEQLGTCENIKHKQRNINNECMNSWKERIVKIKKLES